MNKISIIIPAYNEESTIFEIVNRVIQVKIPYCKEIIIVNDGSTDRTAIEIERVLKTHIGVDNLEIYSLNQNNTGKGGALRLGYAKASGDLLLCQDADLELFPEDYPELLKPFSIHQDAKVVYGSRILGNPDMKRSIYYFGGRLVSLITSMLFFTNITDQPTGYKIFHKDLLPLLLNSKYLGFEWEAEITAKVLKSGFKIHEVPIKYVPRTEGKKLTWKDGIKIIYILFKYRFVSK